MHIYHLNLSIISSSSLTYAKFSKRSLDMCCKNTSYKCKRLCKIQLQGRRGITAEHPQPFSTRTPPASNIEPSTNAGIDLDIATVAKASQVQRGSGFNSFLLCVCILRHAVCEEATSSQIKKEFLLPWRLRLWFVDVVPVAGDPGRNRSG